MLCPMKFINAAVWLDSDKKDGEQYKCHKEECAWWAIEKDWEGCAILSIALDLKQATSDRLYVEVIK